MLQITPERPMLVFIRLFLKEPDLKEPMGEVPMMLSSSTGCMHQVAPHDGVKPTEALHLLYDFLRCLARPIDVPQHTLDQESEVEAIGRASYQRWKKTQKLTIKVAINDPAAIIVVVH
ncbi:MAG: hypothetical protein FRX49_06114 [Trebouxia sp. A1-2]|nr:MAG: hypothetical protein FRX49_06114 [Trebouxia sp. A1-2]